MDFQRHERRYRPLQKLGLLPVHRTLGYFKARNPDRMAVNSHSAERDPRECTGASSPGTPSRAVRNHLRRKPRAA